MTAIVLDKTWQIDYFYRPTDSTSNICVKSMLIDIKNTMKTHGWTVPYSSDSTLLGTGADDYWINYTDIVEAVGDHSWIVLQNDNVCTGFSVCIEFEDPDYRKIYAYCCSSGYNSDGTKSSKPTAIGVENVMLLNNWWFNSGNPLTYNAIMYSSTDGECTRIYWGDGTYYYNSCGVWIFDVPKNPPAWFTTPYVAAITYQNPLIYNYWCDPSTSNSFFITDHAGIDNIKIKLGSIGMTGALGNIQGHRGQDYGGNFIFSPAYLCSVTGSAPGIFGEMFDLYWTTASFAFQTSGTTTGVIKTPGCLPSTLGDCGFQLFWHMAQGNDGIGRGLI